MRKKNKLGSTFFFDKKQEAYAEVKRLIHFKSQIELTNALGKVKPNRVHVS